MHYIKALTEDFLKARVADFVLLAKENIPGEYWEEQHYMTPLKGKWELSLYVEDDRARIVGFIIASEKEMGTHIHKFVVDANCQRSGIGGEMLGFLRKKTEPPITLKVDVGNSKAISFYKKNGFSISTEDRGLYHMILNVN